MAFNCTVVTPEQKLFEGTIVQAIVPGHDGLVGILTDRAPLLLKLGVGPLRLDAADGRKDFYFVDGGVAQMKDNRLTILTGEATPAGEIDFESARAELERASSMAMATEEAFERRQHEMERARTKQALAQR